MAITYETTPIGFFENHVCKFSGHKRASPCGGNRHNVSVIIGECSCGKIQAKYPEKNSYWENRWIDRVNHRIDKIKQNKL